MAWMAFGDIKVEKRFTNWIDTWMYKERKLEATSMDLYGARCSMLHTLTPDSILSKKGKVNIVVYAWGKGDIEHYKEVSKHRGNRDQAFVHVNDLFAIFKEGIDSFLKDVDSDSKLQIAFNERIDSSYENISDDEMQYYRQVLEKHDED